MALTFFKKKPARYSPKPQGNKVFNPVDAAIEESANLQIELHQATSELQSLKQAHTSQQQTLILYQAQIESLTDEVRELNNAKARAEVSRRAAERDAERANQTRQKIEHKIDQMFNLKAEMEANKATTTKLNDDLEHRYHLLSESYEQIKAQLALTEQLQRFYTQLRPIKDQMTQQLRETCQQGQSYLPASSLHSDTHPLEALSAQLNHCNDQNSAASPPAEQEIAWLRELIRLIEQTQLQQVQWQQQLATPAPLAEKSKKPARQLQMTELETHLLTAYENFEVFCQQQRNLQPSHVFTALMALTNAILSALSQLPESPLTIILGDTLSSHAADFHLHQHKLYLKNPDKVADLTWITQTAIPALTELLQLIQLDTLQATGFNYDQANFLHLGNRNALEQAQRFMQNAINA